MTAPSVISKYRFMDTKIGDGVPGAGLMPIFSGNGTPVNGANGSLAGVAPPGSLFLSVDGSNINCFINTNTLASPTWTPIGGNSASLALAALSLAAGTTSVAPLSLASGSLLTTPAAGAIEFDGSAFYATAIANARQQIDAEQFDILAADNSATGRGSAAFAAFNSTANGAITLATGKNYAFEASYIITNTNVTSHQWNVLFGGTAVLASINYSIFGNSAGSAAPATGGLSGWSNAATAVAATPASTSGTENAVIQLNGVISVTTGGTLIPQLQATANLSTDNQVVKAGSFFRIWEMAPGATVGNWS